MGHDLEGMWQDFRTTLPAAERIDLTAELEPAERECAVDSDELLGQWFALTDEGLRFLLALLKLSEEAHVNLEDRRSASVFLMLLARSISLLRSINLLVRQGLEDAARPVARSLLETLDLALVALANPHFADAFMSEDEKRFWNTKIRRRHLLRRLEEVWRRADASPEQITILKVDRAKAVSALSGAVHSCASSALRSWLVPSLRYPGLRRRTCLGHISIHSPALLLAMAGQVHVFGVASLKLLTSHSPPELFDNAVALRGLDSTFAAFLTLQSALEGREGDLPDIEAHFGDGAPQKSLNGLEPRGGHATNH